MDWFSYLGPLPCRGSQKLKNVRTWSAYMHIYATDESPDTLKNERPNPNPYKKNKPQQLGWNTNSTIVTRRTYTYI